MHKLEEILSILVAKASFYPKENGPYAFLQTFLKKLGFQVSLQEVAPNRFNLLAQKGGFKKSVLVYMHIDTVQPVNNWPQNPLKLTQWEDTLTGLGSFDMKGGIAALLASLDSVNLNHHNLKLAFCIDEEGDSAGVFTLIKSDFIKDVKVAFCPEACIVPEKWQLPVMLTIGGRGRSVIQIVVRGKTVHGASDERGINAIEEAAILINNFKNLKLGSYPGFGESTFFVSLINASNPDLSVPDQATIEIDVQLIPGQTESSVRVQFEQFVNDLYSKRILNPDCQEGLSIQIKPRFNPYIMPYLIDKNNLELKKCLKIIENHFGMIDYCYTKSVADQNVIANSGIPIITIGPLGGNVHQAGEWVSLKSLQYVQSLYEEIFNLY